MQTLKFEITEHYKKSVTFILCHFTLEPGLSIRSLGPEADHSLFAALNPSVSVLPTVPLLRAFGVQLFVAELVRPGSLFGEEQEKIHLVIFVIYNQLCAGKRLTTDSPKH